jgi:hypothetical protein
MASFELKCQVVFVGQPFNASENFRKREIIVQTEWDTQYAQTIKIEAIQAKCDDPFFAEARPGDEASIFFNLNGRVYDNAQKKKKEVFNSLQFWKGSLTRTVAQPAQQQQPQYQQNVQPQYTTPQQQQQYQQQPAPVDTSQNNCGDLPF